MDFSRLPSIAALLQQPQMADIPHALAARAARDVVAHAREQIVKGNEVPTDWMPEVLDRVSALRQQDLRRVINATGVVVHTNLGRAPMAPSAVDAIGEVAGGYSNLELDLDSGKRGGRLSAITDLLCELTGAEAAVVVNNNAAAVLLALSALARGREVVVSRGELVEIGGSFRVPDVISDGGATLVEVGSTNRTRASDYAAVITDMTGALLRVHTSNFRMIGFTQKPTRKELVALGAQHGVAVVEDLGSGLLHSAPAMERPTTDLESEELVSHAVTAGIDVVCFSGDKLLGGPQAGMAVGRKEVIARMREHPLYRALRLDKMVLAGLEATLRLYREGDPDRDIPVREMLSRSAKECQEVAQRMASQLPTATVESDTSYSGGGALPGQGIPTHVLCVHVDDPNGLAEVLRLGSPPIVVRVGGGCLRIDPRTLLPGDEAVIVDTLRSHL